MPNISAYLVTEFGWRSGFLVYGLITLTLVVPLVLRLVISRPEDVAQFLTAQSLRPNSLPSKRLSEPKSSWVIEIFGSW